MLAIQTKVENAVTELSWDLRSMVNAGKFQYGCDENVIYTNKFLSEKINEDFYGELEVFAKTDKGKDVLQFTGNGKYLQA